MLDDEEISQEERQNARKFSSEGLSPLKVESGGARMMEATSSPQISPN